MNDRSHDLRQISRVLDAELAGRQSTPAAQSLLATLVAEPADPGAVARARRWRPRRRLALVAAAAIVATVAAVAGPALLRGPGATSYANSAIEIRRDGDFYVARIKDPLADHARYAEAFRAVGKDVDIELVPVSPRRVGMLLYSGSGGSGFGGSRVETEIVPTGSERFDCALDPARCTIVIKISVDSSGWIRFKVGRAAQPGEALQDCAPPSACPEPPAGAPSAVAPSAGTAGGN
jgi:hypothetical protein